MKKNILVIKLGALGDFIQALGPMKAIRNHHPKDNITLLTTKPFMLIAQKSGYFNHVEIDEKPKIFQLKKWISLKKKLNTADYTRVYDLQNNDRTNIYFNLFYPKPEWVGIAKGASHRNMSKKRVAGLAFQGHAQTLGFAGIDTVSIDTLDWMESDIEKFNIKKPYALIISGSAPQHPKKRWPKEKFLALCHHLKEQNIQPVLIGTQAESQTLDYIYHKCPNARHLGGKTKLDDLPALARHAEFAIGNDTGPIHLIAPTGCKTIVLFSSASNPVRHAPLGKNVITLQKNDLADLSLEKVIARI